LHALRHVPAPLIAARGLRQIEASGKALHCKFDYLSDEAG